ncbi:hypothetical protein O1611_g9519 [Lasiodiplodia mahajangana]|uniref:Uncharacterized protein n=1 Tax=Lasiodiplodia mahajangana TaxID=1108764 RepID=A0ACC2J8I1_9PEZI|nr:hypothetical protein O1611_g9519 [Lasiodiplodia mahajangana]
MEAIITTISLRCPGKKRNYATDLDMAALASILGLTEPTIVPLPSAQKPKQPFGKNHQALMEKITKRWGFSPCEIFPENSPHQPKLWTITTLEGLRDLSQIASFEQATEILQRTIPAQYPLSVPVIKSAIAECQRTNSRGRMPISTQSTAANSETDAEDVVFVAGDGTVTPHSNSSSAEQEVKFGIRSGSSSEGSSPNGSGKLQPLSSTITGPCTVPSFATTCALSSSNTSPNKRRRIETNSVETPPIPETPNYQSTSQYDLRLIFKSKNAHAFAKHWASLAACDVSRRLEAEYIKIRSGHVLVLEHRRTKGQA